MEEINIPKAQLETLIQQNKELKDFEKKIVEAITKVLTALGLIDEHGNKKEDVKLMAIIKKIPISELMFGKTEWFEKNFPLKDIQTIFEDYKKRNP